MPRDEKEPADQFKVLEEGVRDRGALRRRHCPEPIKVDISVKPASARALTTDRIRSPRLHHASARRASEVS